MWKTGIVITLMTLLASCAPGFAPNGMTWEEYQAADYRLKVTHRAEDVIGCQELGHVQGSSTDGVAEAKDDARKQALMFRGNTLLFEKLWSDLTMHRWFDPEIFYAEGTVYRCGE